jgi:hypothetical protein
MLLKIIENKRKIIVFIFFLSLLLLGLSIFKDYGVHWDEYFNQEHGDRWWAYVLNALFGKSFAYDASFSTPYIIRIHDRVHGPIFEIFLSFLCKGLLKLTDSRDIIFIRHLFTFLFFYIAVCFFYLTVKFRFKSWKIGLLGSSFLILSPRIFADSFYNSVDIPFLSAYIISIYTLLRYLEKKTLFRASLHALTCAILIDIRIPGIFLPLCTFIFLLADLFVNIKQQKEIKGIIKTATVFMFLLIVFTVLFWPFLWKDPLRNFIESFRGSFNALQVETPLLYLGNVIKIWNAPWHYLPIWIIISTPIFYVLCFFIGCLDLIKQLLIHPLRFYINEKNDFVFISCLFLPIIAAIVFKAGLFDAWRHLFFIYPLFLIVSLWGLKLIFDFMKIKFQGLSYKIINITFILCALFSLINTAKFMVKNHPYQNIYFNILGGRNMEEIKNNFELDYWGLSYRKALEYILRNDASKVIKIYVPEVPGRISAKILTLADRDRLVYVEQPQEAKYFLSIYKWHKDEYPYAQEYFSIKVGGAKIVIVYKL